MNPKYEYIKTVTEDLIQLSGLYCPGNTSKPAVIFIHGFTSDFYSPVFAHSISASLVKQGNAIMLAQNRGTGIQTEFIKTDGSGVYIGSYYELLEEAHLDITAHIDFLLSQGHKDIVLMGHSLGTIKVTRYLFEGKYKNLIKKLALLAPFDKNAFMVRKAKDHWNEFLRVAKEKIDSGNGSDIVPVPEYEDYGLTYKTFISWYNKSELSCIWDFYRNDYDGKLLKKIKIPVKAIIGSLDEGVDYPEFSENPQKVLNFLQSHIPDCDTTLVEGAPHTYLGHEDIVAQEISAFLAK